MNKIKRIYVRHYHDNGQRKAYVDWEDGSRTEGESSLRYWQPLGAHMKALFARGQREGLSVEREEWGKF